MTDPLLESQGEFGEDPAPRDTGLTARDLLAAIRRRWWAVFAVLLVVVSVAMWRTLRQPRMYQATATVRFTAQQSPITGAPLGSPRYDFRVDQLASEQILMKSTAVAMLVADALGMRLTVVAPPGVDRGTVFGNHVPKVDSLSRSGEYRLVFERDKYSLRAGAIVYDTAPYGEPVSGTGITVVVPENPKVEGDQVVLQVIPLASAARTVQAMVSTAVIPSTDVMQIIVTGTDRFLVRDAANAVAHTYAEFSSEGLRSTAEQKSEFIQRSLRDQARALAAAQDSLERFQRTHQTVDVTSEQAAVLGTIHALEAERRTVLVDQNVYRRLIGRLGVADTVEADLRRLVGTDAVTRNQHIANLYERWFELSKEREQLLKRLTPSHDDVKAVDASISQTKRELQDASRMYLEALDSRLASLDRNIEEARQQAERFPPLAAEQARHVANVETMQKTYDNLLAQYQLARINQSAEGGTVRIIDEASLPSFAISPNRRRALMYAVFIGLLLGVAAAVLLEKMDDSVKSPEDLQERLDVPVLGLIPAIRAAESEGSGRDAPAMNRLVTHADPRSPVAESYRSLRTNLAFARVREELRTLVLTSPGPADGKSTTVANLAITFAQQGQRTLLVDGDLRRAVIDRTFSVPRSPGLTDVIVGSTTLEQAARETEVPNLLVMPSGQLPPNPSELLGSAAMRQIIAEARESFDMVLFDSPPLLAVTDAAVLSSMVDGTLLIVRTNKTARGAARRALAHLRAVHARVLGAVLNDVRAGAGGYYGGYGYYYYAYYGSEGNGNGRAGIADRLRDLAQVGSGRRRKS